MRLGSGSGMGANVQPRTIILGVAGAVDGLLDRFVVAKRKPFIISTLPL